MSMKDFFLLESVAKVPSSRKKIHKNITVTLQSWSFQLLNGEDGLVGAIYIASQLKRREAFDRLYR